MYWYEIGLGVEKHWKSAVFTYEHPTKLTVGTLVRVPFGNKKRLGIVVRDTEKPVFKLKSIDNVYDFTFSQTELDFMKWYQSYYHAESGQVYSQFLPSYLTATVKSTTSPEKTYSGPLELTSTQEKAVREINSTKRPSVLHGITSSGKTRIYTKLILEQLVKGKNALVLYPEIALTPQIVSELEQYAPVIAFHSQMTNAERSKLWFMVMINDQPIIIVGPRSSLFLPHKNLGIIIVDESHETSYKQENDIRYNSVHVAGGLAKVHKAKLVLGSATPSVADTEHILKSGGNLVCVHEKVLKTHAEKSILIIDAKKRELFKKHSLISDSLIQATEQALSKKEQILLFINRRGTAKVTLCSSDTCDWQATCDRCELPMTYHHDTHELLCHTCGKRATVNTSCPVCGSSTKLQALGSKAVVDDIQKLFPNAKIGRFDSDTAKLDSMSENYKDIRSGSVDIFVGTQQLIKGLDLPKLSTIGVLNADLSLHFPDFSSDERTFQLIAQALGRVGRGHKKAVVVLQTFQPNNPVIQLAVKEDWHAFRDIELASRMQHSLSPYSFNLKLIFREKSQKTAEKKATEAKTSLTKLENIEIDGPLPSFYLKRGGFYYVQLHVKSTSRLSLLKCLNKIPSNSAIVDLDPSTLL